ncbi:unnamed protein product [Acanthoscelides obtectus]|uniref:Hexosyltransferase n=1 Tax=Acanthoscelides obtectus TaxID=200917 RepID=A0A9P0NWS5_ACAOB|nr:unnamed protein product [Acanthoscelides obtectus]CAK1641132.1 hypothetical protein AOBTE_LOCUS12181 [Acanthoscelides obtectus]
MIGPTDRHTDDWKVDLLPPNDYNSIIDISFNFTMINFVCDETSPLLLILIHTAPTNYVKRKTVRETWGQEVDGVKVLFMVSWILFL